MDEFISNELRVYVAHKGDLHKIGKSGFIGHGKVGSAVYLNKNNARMNFKGDGYVFAVVTSIVPFKQNLKAFWLQLKSAFACLQRVYIIEIVKDDNA